MHHYMHIIDLSFEVFKFKYKYKQKIFLILLKYFKIVIYSSCYIHGFRG